ncbi:MAG: ABC transporter ATP-binding protein [Acidimicrobiia bacterium]|nr:ABC transporter ATP-binding protein [Acidimicrobiia bacterium]
MADSPPAIEVTEISYSYGDVLAVDGVSFEVAPGEIFGLLGPNGAGKSTTVKMLTGQIGPDSGSIRVLGMDTVSDTSKYQGRIGVCFEEKNLYTAMSGHENLRFFGRLFGIKDLDTAALLDRVDLGPRGDDRVADYSKGMRQRLMMARALINRPDVLFLDEPTDGLDPVSARTIQGLITQEAERGVAVVLTTHDMHEADTLSDRVAFINQGKILALDAPEALKLQHGQRSVRIRSLGNAGEIEETTIPLEGSGVPDSLQDTIANLEVLTIHTEEATLEDVFVAYAGRGLGA